MITINGFNIETEWGLQPAYEGYYNALLAAPAMKNRITNNWTDEDGTEVLYDMGYVESKVMTLKFACDCVTHYNSFMYYIISHPTVTLKDTDIDVEYDIEYMSTSDFHHYRDYNLFGIKVRQRIKSTLEKVFSPEIITWGNALGLETLADYQSYSGAMDLSNKGMTSVKGIQYLQGITSINLTYNDFTSSSVSDILSDVRYLYDDSGNLMSVLLNNNNPPVDYDNDVNYLYLISEGLNISLDLSAYFSPEIISWGENLGFTTFMDYQNYSGSFILSSQGISGALRGIPYLVNITILDVHNNTITDIGDVSNMVNLTILHVAVNQLTNIGILDNLVKLKHLYLYTNNFTNIGDLSGMVDLIDVYININNFSGAELELILEQLWTAYQTNQILTTINISNNAGTITDLTYFNLLTNAGVTVTI